MSGTPNRDIVLLTVDSLRADHCGFLGATGDAADLTPTMDGLADDGVVFADAVAPGPRTPSSMPELFTGAPTVPGDDRPGDDYWQRQRGVIRRHMRRHRSVAERLRGRGYTTVGVTANPWTQGTGFDRGFDRFVEVNSGTLGSYGPSVFRGADRVLNDTHVGDRLSWDNKREWFIRWTDFYDSVEPALTDESGPVFLWVFLLDTHQPYLTPERFRRESSALGMYYASFSELSRDRTVPAHVDTRLRRAYRDSVRSVDEFLARLRADAGGTDPILVVHADHGEAFGEHGTYGHERQLYRENLHVPLFVANADGHDRTRVDDPVSLRRLPDIVTDLADDGRVTPEEYTAEFAVATCENATATCVGGREWRYVRDADGEELYHRPSDPEERSNVAGRHPAVAAALGRVADRYHADRDERATIADAVRAARGPDAGDGPIQRGPGSTGGVAGE